MSDLLDDTLIEDLKSYSIKETTYFSLKQLNKLLILCASISILIIISQTLFNLLFPPLFGVGYFLWQIHINKNPKEIRVYLLKDKMSIKIKKIPIEFSYSSLTVKEKKDKIIVTASLLRGRVLQFFKYEIRPSYIDFIKEMENNGAKRRT